MTRVAGELVLTERVGREEAIVPHMPADGITEAARMIENGDADRLAIQRAVVIDPFGRLAPAGFLAGLAAAVDDLAALFRVHAHRIGHAEAERSFLRIAELDRPFAARSVMAKSIHRESPRVPKASRRSSSRTFLPWGLIQSSRASISATGPLLTFVKSRWTMLPVLTFAVLPLLAGGLLSAGGSDQKSMPLTLPCVNQNERWCGWSLVSSGLPSMGQGRVTGLPVGPMIGQRMGFVAESVR